MRLRDSWGSLLMALAIELIGSQTRVFFKATEILTKFRISHGKRCLFLIFDRV